MHMRFRTFCLTMLLLLMLTGTALAASGQHEVTAGKLYFREEASAQSPSIATLRKGTVVTVLGVSGSWAKARWNGQEGYLAYEYLSRITAQSTGGGNTTELSGTAYADGEAALYRAADVGSDKLATLSGGTKLSLRGETMKFYYVKADGQTGYVLKSKTALQKSEPASDSDGATGDLLDRAQEHGWLCMGCQGSEVKALQERLSGLDYLSSGLNTGYFGELTDKAVRKFQQDNQLDADGVVGPATQKKLDAAGKGSSVSSSSSSSASSSASSSSSTKEVVEMDWYETNVSSLVAKRGGTAKIIDCATGVVIQVRRVGGSSHMDLEPKTAQDTEKLLKLYGGKWSWDRRAVILVAGGKYIAASINGMPHGDQISTDNNFDGQFCLHTTNSRTHGTDQVNAAHQSAIAKALKYEL